MSYFWKMSLIRSSDLSIFNFCSEKHSSFIGKARFRRATLSCDSSYYTLNESLITVIPSNKMSQGALNLTMTSSSIEDSDQPVQPHIMFVCMKMLWYPYSAQTVWIGRLIWVFAGRKCHYVGFSMQHAPLKLSVSPNFINTCRTDKLTIAVNQFKIS